MIYLAHIYTSKYWSAFKFKSTIEKNMKIQKSVVLLIYEIL